MFQESSKVRVLAVVTVLALVPTALGGAKTYDAYWGDSKFGEAIDPIDRFVHFPPLRNASTGVAHVALIPPARETSGPATLPDSSVDAEVAAYLASQQRSGAEALERIALALSGDPRAVTLLPVVADLLHADRFADVAALLADTPAAITYWCGEVLAGTRWIVGIPFVAPCGHPALSGLGFAFETHLRPPGAIGQTISFTDITPLQPGITTPVVGIGFGQGVLLVASKGARTTEINLRTGPAADPVETFYQVGISSLGFTSGNIAGPNFIGGDSVSFTWGDEPYKDATYSLVIERSRTFVSLTAFVRPLAGLQVTVAAGGPREPNDEWREFRGDLPLADGSRVTFIAREFPQAFRVAYQRLALTAEADVTEIAFEDALTTSPRATMEILGSYVKERPLERPDPEIGFQIVGFAVKNALRIVIPHAVPEGEIPVAAMSFDLSKRDAAVPGRYRAIVVDGHASGNDIAVVGSNLHRAQIGFMEDDRWKEDVGGEDRMVLVGATANVMPDSALDVRATNPFLAGHRSFLEYKNADEAEWHTNTAGLFQSDELARGNYHLHDGLIVNSHLWNIAENQLNSDEICALRYEHNECA